MKMKAPRVTILKESRDRNARMKLLEEIVKHCLKLKPNLIMLVLGQQDGYLYNKMKSLGDVQYGVHTQCILSKNAKGNKLNPQLINNVQGVRKKWLSLNWLRANISDFHLNLCLCFSNYLISILISNFLYSSKSTPNSTASTTR